MVLLFEILKLKKNNIIMKTNIFTLLTKILVIILPFYVVSLSINCKNIPLFCETTIAGDIEKKRPFGIASVLGTSICGVAYRRAMAGVSYA